MRRASRAARRDTRLVRRAARGFAEPSSYWYFRLFAHRPAADDVDDRVFLLGRLPDEAAERVAALGRSHSRPVTWPVGDDVAALADAADAPTLLAASTTFDDVERLWRMGPRPTR